jgi:GNAT superfamily N-acetyltransferase
MLRVERMATPYDLRRAIDGDIAILVRLINSAYAAEAAALYTRERTDEGRVRTLLANGEMIVAVDRDEVVGSVHVRQTGERCEISTLAVEPRRQGCGLGRQLMEAAEAWARERDIVVATFAVINHRDDLLPFYKSLGYAIVGDAPFPYPNEIKVPCHFILLSKPLL